MQLLHWKNMSGPISLICVVVFLINFTFAAKAPTPVTINKCCRIGEQLDKSKACMPGASEKWWPKVFLIGPSKYFSKEGEAPQHMKIAEQNLPDTCTYPEYFSGVNSLVLISNGSLFISDRNIMAPPEDYCVDNNVALVCYHKDMDALMLPQILSQTRKCCGPSSVYSKQNATCINLDRTHELFDTAILKSPQVDIRFGFPECEIQDFAIAGQLNEADFDDNTGTLTMSETKKVFVTNQFCLEYVIDGNTHSKQVFACSEHFPHIEAPTQPNDVRFSLYSIGLLISVVFLAATLAAGFLVPSNHHVLHWRCQTNYIVCLLVGDLLLAITQLAGNAIVYPFCTMIGE
jgi:G protein-coupled receptor Mth (Methuselah protein)